MEDECTSADLRLFILNEVSRWGSQKAVALRMGISAAYLSDVLLQRRDPGPKIADYFGLTAVTLYRPRDSGSGRHGGDNSLAPCEAPQSGDSVSGASPGPSSEGIARKDPA